MEALADELRRGEGLLLAHELPPDAVSAKAAFAASVRAFLLQQARRPGAFQGLLLSVRGFTAAPAARDPAHNRVQVRLWVCRKAPKGQVQRAQVRRTLQLVARARCSTAVCQAVLGNSGFALCR